MAESNSAEQSVEQKPQSQETVAVSFQASDFANKGKKGGGRRPDNRSNEPLEGEPKTAKTDEKKPAGRALRRLLDAEIEDAEMETAMSGFEGKELLKTQPGEAPAKSAPKQQEKPRRGEAPQEEERKLVRVLAIQPDYIYVDLAEKSEGIIPTAQFLDKFPKIGDLVEVVLDRFDPAQHVNILRRPGASREAEWGAVEKGMIVDASVKGVNKGGLEVTINGIKGFLPAGQVDIVHVQNLNSLIGQTLRCRIMEIDRSAKNLVVSRRMILEEERAEKAKETLETLEEGQIREGVVRKVMDFSAFVDLGGVDGMVHVSQMSWTKVGQPSDILSPGQHVKVVVLAVDKETRKISLGLRQLTDSPWLKVVTTYPSGMICPAKITRIADFGAFAELEPGIEGLIHISELSTRRVSRASTVVKEGELVTVKILEVDPERQRLSLSIKAVSAAAEAAQQEENRQKAAEEAEEETGVGSVIKKSNLPLKGGLGGNSGPLFG